MSVVCETCNDTHLMWHSGLEREVMCTRCPTPCEDCREGAYCRRTPCRCLCHGASWTREQAVRFVLMMLSSPLLGVSPAERKTVRALITAHSISALDLLDLRVRKAKEDY